jgi:hypothetical protein
MGVTAIICIATIVLAIIIVLTILVYNQMLLLNEVNKRLLLFARESIEKERMTQEELQEALVTIEQMSNEQTPQGNQVFEPEFHDDDLEI